jgi:hypothetical protein
MGASDATIVKEALLLQTDDGGGVRAPSGSIIANYFLKSHGGAHLFQSICSVMAVAASFGAFVAASKSSAKWTLVLLRRALIFAMIKHMTGLISSAVIAAKAVPRIGLNKSRQWMEQVVRDPVSHYIFYTAVLLVWLPNKGLVVETAKAASTAAVAKTANGAGVSTAWWWPKHVGWLISIVLGPILLREVISTLLVISDVMILWSLGEENITLDRILASSQSVINALMSLLVSPTQWRTADPSERQAILASLVSKISLAFEGAVAAILFFDLLIGFVQLAFGAAGSRQRPSLRAMFLKLIIVRLYVHYMLYIRRSKYSKLAAEVRGGASQLPFWVVDTLYNPIKAMGININANDASNGQEDDVISEMSILEYVRIGFGFEDDAAKQKS